MGNWVSMKAGIGANRSEIERQLGVPQQFAARTGRHALALHKRVVSKCRAQGLAPAHARLQGLADRPVSLYEDVLNWQIAWRAPQE